MMLQNLERYVCNNTKIQATKKQGIGWGYSHLIKEESWSWFYMLRHLFIFLPRPFHLTDELCSKAKPLHTEVVFYQPSKTVAHFNKRVNI